MINKFSSKYKSTLFKNFKTIEQKLKKERNLNIEQEIQAYEWNDSSFALVSDQIDQQFTIKIIYIFNEKSQIYSNNIEDALMFASLCKFTDHPSVIRYIDEFKIDKYYCILFEKYASFDYQSCKKRQGEFLDSTYLKFALQILEGVKYLHSKGIYLNDETFKTLLLDKNQNVKIASFEQSNELTQQECIDRIIADCQKIFLFLYKLAGAKVSQIIEIKKDQSNFKMQLSINHEINFILKQAFLLIHKEGFQLQEIIDKFQKINNYEDQYHSHEQSEEEKKQFEIVLQLFEQNQLENAIQILSKLIEDNPRNDIYLAWIGRCYNGQKNYELSYYWSQICLKINENNEIAYFNLGNYYKQKFMNQKSIEYYKKSMLLDPLNNLAYNNLGTAYQILNLLQKSNLILKKAIKLKSNVPHYYYNISRSYFFQQNFEQSLKHINRSMKLGSIQSDSVYINKTSKAHI